MAENMQTVEDTREEIKFNLREFDIKKDERGMYTEEPLLLGIANHLQVNGSIGDVTAAGGGLLMYNGSWGELTALGQNVIRQASTHIMMYGSMKGRKIGYKGERCCTSGPGGWYTAGGIPFYWGWYRRNGKGTPVTDCNLASQGFKKIWEGKMGNGNPPVEFYPTDVVAIYTTHASHQHGVIWTGKEWLSDYIQRVAMCGSYYASIETYSQLWRHPKCWTKPPVT